MPSVQRYDLYCARYNGQWASEIRVDLDPNDGHKTGWDSSQTYGTSMYYPNETSYGGGSTGSRKIWDNDEAYFYSGRGPGFGPASGTYDAGSFPFNRNWGNDGDSYYIKHAGWSNRDGGALGLPLPTYTLSMSGGNGWRSSGGSEPGSAVVNKNLSWTHTYQSWVGGYARDPIVIYTKPYIPDQTMTITSLTTANQYAPGNLQSTVLLKQPSIYTSLSITSTDTGTTIPASEGNLGFGEGATIWNDVVARMNAIGIQRYVKIVAYMPHWNSVNDIEFAWNITGAGASSFNIQNGTINNFAPLTTSGWTDYAYGYQPVNIAIGDIAAKSTNINIVANGLKFSSGNQTRNYNIR